MKKQSWGRVYHLDYGQPQVTPTYEPECAFDRIMRDYRARGVPMPTGWLLDCSCRRCKPITL